MARDEAYQEAERQIEAARQEGAIELDLSGLGLTALPEAIAALTQLQYLDLSRNQLIELPDSLVTLEKLHSLYISRNELDKLPEVLFDLPSLKTIFAFENNLTALPSKIANLSQLSTLGLNHNKLTDLPESFSQLKKLEHLAIGNNEFCLLPDSLTKMNNIKRLYIQGNSTKDISLGLSNLTSLETLNISDLGLMQIPDAIARISSLEFLFVDNNHVKDLPLYFHEFENLKDISLDNNPLNPDVAAAANQGSAAIQQYLRARSNGETLLNEAKLILVGEGEVGKSCLLGALRGDEWVDGRPTTHGIEIKSVVVTAPDNATGITLNGWDFGGQRVYRPTHQLFFSSSAVYLVVWKPREGPQQGFVKEWITLIKHRESDAKVLVVATHGGPGQRQPDIDRQELIDLFGSDTVVGFFHVNSKPHPETQVCTGIAELREAIANVAATLPGMGRLVPTKWQQIRELLEASGKTHMPYADVLALCEEHGLEGFAAELFVRVSHTLGYFIHYDYDEILKDIVILQPDWLAKAISYVLDDETTRQRYGLVEFDHLSHLWIHPPFVGETGYPKELHPIFLRLMERFDLSYKVVLDPANPEANTTSLIAQLVPDQRPEQLPNWGEQPEGGDRQQVQICRIMDDRGWLTDKSWLKAVEQLVTR
ncbi:COR domain-containing protein [Leptolyngbya sp. KIOST-1]|uniref:COR domain-containing protein n=1 Tax=Leptolyngbya sp. KIOST-1 TaxID=1229172 RepID=UPI000907797D|nr:COR domain-containing protein [Leptolyngbya sp. KIOST-1]